MVSPSKPHGDVTRRELRDHGVEIVDGEEDPVARLKRHHFAAPAPKPERCTMGQIVFRPAIFGVHERRLQAKHIAVKAIARGASWTIATQIETANADRRNLRIVYAGDSLSVGIGRCGAPACAKRRNSAPRDRARSPRRRPHRSPVDPRRADIAHERMGRWVERDAMAHRRSGKSGQDDVAPGRVRVWVFRSEHEQQLAPNAIRERERPGIRVFTERAIVQPRRVKAYRSFDGGLERRAERQVPAEAKADGADRSRRHIRAAAEKRD